MTDDNVTRLPPRRKPELATVTDGKATTLFDADGNMRRMPAEHARTWRDRFYETYANDLKEQMDNDPSIRIVIETAQRALNRMLEEELWRLVFEPPQKPIYQRGDLVGFEPVVQTKHAEWMAERFMPDRYHLATKTQLMSGAGSIVKFGFEMGDAPLELEASDAEYEDTGDDAA